MSRGWELNGNRHHKVYKSAFIRHIPVLKKWPERLHYLIRKYQFAVESSLCIK